MYKADIEFRAYEDDYENGEGDFANSWQEVLTADTKSELSNCHILVTEVTEKKASL